MLFPKIYILVLLPSSFNYSIIVKNLKASNLNYLLKTFYFETKTVQKYLKKNIFWGFLSIGGSETTSCGFVLTSIKCVLCKKIIGIVE